MKWYNQVFQINADRITHDTEISLTETRNQFLTGLEQTKENASHDIDTYRTSTMNSSESELQAYNQHYLDRLAEAKQNLMKDNLDEYVNQREKELDSELTQDTEKMLTEILGN